MKYLQQFPSLILLLCIGLASPGLQAQNYPGGLSQPGMWINASNTTPATNGSSVTLMTDLSGNLGHASDNAGAITTIPTLNTTSVNGLAGVVFDGVNDFLQVATTAALNDDGNGYSQKNITMVIKTSADVTTQQMLYEQGDDTRGISIFIKSGQINIGLWSSICVQKFIAGAIAASQVQIITLDYDQTSSILRLYVNGTLLYLTRRKVVHGLVSENAG